MESIKKYLTNGGLVTHSDTPQGFLRFIREPPTGHALQKWSYTICFIYPIWKGLYTQFENTGCLIVVPQWALIIPTMQVEGSKATPAVRVFLHATAINDIYDISKSTATSMAGLLQRMNLSSEYAKKRAWRMTSHVKHLPKISIAAHLRTMCRDDFHALETKHFWWWKNDLFVDSSPPGIATKKQNKPSTLYDWNTCTLLAIFFQNLYQLL